MVTVSAEALPRNEAAERNACEWIELQRNRFEDLAAYVLEIDIDSLGRRRAKIPGEIPALAIDERIASRLRHKPK
jgi:hypothetical protein